MLAIYLIHSMVDRGSMSFLVYSLDLEVEEHTSHGGHF